MNEISLQQIQDEQGYLVLACPGRTPPVGTVLPGFNFMQGTDPREIPVVVIGQATLDEWGNQAVRYIGRPLSDGGAYCGFVKVIAE